VPRERDFGKKIVTFEKNNPHPRRGVSAKVGVARVGIVLGKGQGDGDFQTKSPAKYVKY
jgi:hypothetical protein